MSRINIYLDESVDVAIAVGLKRRGVEAFTARDAGELGITDEEQLTFANEIKAAVFTHDSDFLQIAAGWIEEGKKHHGIIYSHQKRYTIGECIRRLKFLTTVLTMEDMIRHIEFL